MNYPLISEYIEAIKAAEDNFDQLKHLRPVLGGDREPVMTSGNFAVVFKMKDEQRGKLYALKCFTKEQEGRAEAYKLITEELATVDSPYILSIKYLEKELFVDTMQTNEIEFPVLLMDWVEGKTLDKYIRENIEDRYSLEMLAYRFSQLAQWLMPQPFAHGDLKPDNILVRENGTLVLVDYDGMYVPAMKGQKARELGSPDFRHPLRTVDDFDEHIDDFSIASVLLSLKAISLQSSLLEEYGASNRLLFSERDYRNISESRVMDALKSLMQDTELALLYSLFILATTQKNLSQLSSRLFNLSRPNITQYAEEAFSTEVTEDDLSNGWKDEFGVIYSADRKRVLKAPDSLKGMDYTIRKGTRVICVAAFQSIGLHGITLPDTVTTIGSIAFANNADLEYCNIPISVKYIYENNPWGGCFNIKKVDCMSPLFCIEDGLLYSSDYRVVYGLLYWNANMFLNIKARKIVSNAFWCGHSNYNTFIKEVSLNNVTSIGKSAFVGCCGLTSITIPNKVKHIEDSVFLGCANLKSIVIPNGVTTIDKYAFKDCTSLFSITIPKSVTKIGKYAFKGCTSLSSVTIPNSVTTIEDAAFWGCSNLSSIVIPGNTCIGMGVFDECTGLKIKRIEYANVDSFLSVIFNEKFTSPYWINDNFVREILDDDGFKVTSVVVPEGTKTIPNWAFVNCIGLTSIEIPNSVTSIGYGAFEGCTGLTSIKIPNSVTSIGDEAFAGCTGLTSIKIPDSVTRINDFAFAGCIGMTTIEFLGSVDYICEDAFINCKALEQIIIPIGLKYYFENLLPEYKFKLVEQ